MKTLKIEKKQNRINSNGIKSAVKIKLKNVLTNSSNIGLPIMKIKLMTIAGLHAGLDDENEY